MLNVAVIYPELLGTYGDAGNALVLVERARRRGISSQLHEVRLGERLPDAAIFLLGGGEDGPQRQATEALRTDGTLGRRVGDGATLFAVCAGLQIVGTTFEVEGGVDYDGLALVELVTKRGPVRHVGELRCDVLGHRLVGFENHGGISTLGSTTPFGQVRAGFGNNGVTDGFRGERLWATYAHGPVLALNPWLADQLIAEATGQELAPLTTVADQLYEQRSANS